MFLKGGYSRNGSSALSVLLHHTVYKQKYLLYLLEPKD